MEYGGSLVLLRVLILLVILELGTSALENVNSKNNERKAFVTILTLEQHVDATLVMGLSLQAMTRKYDSQNVDFMSLILPVSDDALTENLIKRGIGITNRNARRLEQSGWQVKTLPHPIFNQHYNIHSTDWDLNEYTNSIDLNQLWIYSLQQDYDKIIYLHYDILILQDITDLFDIDIWDVSFTDPNLAAAPKSNPANQFDCGVLVIKPDLDTFADLIREVKRKDDTTSHGKGFCAFMNEMFSYWYDLDRPHRLLPIYNAPFSWTLNEQVWLEYRSDIKVIHWNDAAGDEKPYHILANPDKYKISKFGAGLLYVWAIFMFFLSQATDHLVEEARYVLLQVFDITKSSKKIKAYTDRLKQGGTRKRLSIDGIDFHTEL